jgi:predicted regulator of Ras-like GTPase activity (Roadblock/LC7/MglB family)
MPPPRRGSPSVHDQVQAELELIRTHVAGVRGSLAATSDGLVVAQDVPDVEPTQVAALAAATLALASRATLATGCGNFREAVARGSDGYLAVYAAGHSTIVAVIGSSSLNVGMLQYRAREFIERIAAYSTQTGAPAAAGRTGAKAPVTRGQARADGRAGARSSLPKRRPPAS